MQDKLQELTDKLYNQGLSKGKQEGEAILENARKEAAEILKGAEKSAEEIKAKAAKEAEAYKTKVEGDVKMAAVQAVQAVRKEIENLIVAKIISEPSTKALDNAAFLAGIIKTVAEKFNSQEQVELSVILPEAMQAEIGNYLKGASAAILEGDVSFSRKFSGGFKIGPKDGGYFIDFSDEAFAALLGEYMRPATRKLLFG